jgi:formylglycine-generating enzyme required for sulfatase activity
MHSERSAGVAKRDELVAHVATYYESRRAVDAHEAEGLARQTLSSLLQYSGLLTERGEGQFGFTHLSFQEFLAARHMVLQGQIDRHETARMVLRHASLPEWAEVIQLAVGYVGVVAKEEEGAALLVEALLGEADHTKSTRALVLAGACAADCGKEGVGVACWEAVQQAVLGAFEDPAMEVGSRRDLGPVLDGLDDPRFQTVPRLIDLPPGIAYIGTPETDVRNLISEIEKVDLPESSEWVRRYWRTTVDSEAPAHEVDLGALRISRFPLTNREYSRFIDAVADYPVPTGDAVAAAAFAWDPDERTFPVRRGNHPVVMVTWVDACAYCEWLSSLTGRSFSLPTEAEWEYAARGAQRAAQYPWGDDWDAGFANTLDDGPSDTVAVGCYAAGASPWGVEDCIGQVWEWTSTSWGDSWQETSFPYPISGNRRDAPDAGAWKVVRGGSWDDVGAFARCAARGPNLRTFKSHYIGFRVAERT